MCGAPSLLALGERCHRLLLLAVINSLLTPALPSPHTQQHSNTGNSSRSKARLSSTCGWWLVKRTGVKEVAKERGLGLAGREGGRGEGGGMWSATGKKRGGSAAALGSLSFFRKNTARETRMKKSAAGASACKGGRGMGRKGGEGEGVLAVCLPCRDPCI